jgi:inosose dehydratase
VRRVSHGPRVSRRTFFQTTATVAARSAVAPLVAAPIVAAGLEPRAFAGPRPLPLKIGLTSYSMRKQSLDQVIELCNAAEVKYLSLKDMHLPFTATADQLEAARDKIEAAGITVTGGGVIWMKDAAGVRSAFDYARAARLPLIIGGPEPSLLDLVEQMVRKHGIPVAIHNQGPDGRIFPSPYDVLAAVKKRDKRLGACMDIGNTVRLGLDPSKCVADLGDRLFDLHVKDLKSKKDNASQVEVGFGQVDIAGLLRALARRRFQGNVALEYELHIDNPTAGIRESLAYLRGAAAAL